MPVTPRPPAARARRARAAVLLAAAVAGAGMHCGNVVTPRDDGPADAAVGAAGAAPPDAPAHSKPPSLEALFARCPSSWDATREVVSRAPMSEHHLCYQTGTTAVVTVDADDFQRGVVRDRTGALCFTDTTHLRASPVVVTFADASGSTVATMTYQDLHHQVVECGGTSFDVDVSAERCNGWFFGTTNAVDGRCPP
jgi:hypothetical protein